MKLKFFNSQGLIVFLLFLGIISITGCKNAYLLEERQEIGNDQAILLIDLQGQSPINYVQLGGVFPAINLRFNAKHDEMVAIVVPVGIKGIEFNCFTYDNKPSGYIPIGYTSIPHGYISVDDVPIDVPKAGVYFLGTLNTDTQSFSTRPNPERLLLANTKYGELLKKLKPMNFVWPQ